MVAHWQARVVGQRGGTPDRDHRAARADEVEHRRDRGRGAERADAAAVFIRYRRNEFGRQHPAGVASGERDRTVLQHQDVEPFDQVAFVQIGRENNFEVEFEVLEDHARPSRRHRAAVHIAERDPGGGELEGPPGRRGLQADEVDAQFRRHGRHRRLVRPGAGYEEGSSRVLRAARLESVPASSRHRHLPPARG